MWCLVTVKSVSDGAALALHGFFGGTFDPIHHGHLRMALELKEQLGFDSLALLPSRQPPHRDCPGGTGQQRAEMVALALRGCPALHLDARELTREGPSYSIDTLAELRHELGPDVSVCWCVGMDSLATLDRWHRWRELLDYAHLVVVARPGWSAPVVGELAEWLAHHRGGRDALRLSPAGRVVIEPLSLLDISATDIRRRVACGNSVQFLVPDTVQAFIDQQGLYR